MKFIATVEKSQKSNIHRIAGAMKDMGIDVDQVLKITGVITGSTKNKDLATVKIKGVKSVEAERKVHKLRSGK